MPLSVPAGVSAHLKLAPEGQDTPYWRDMSLFGVAICRQISSYAHFSSEMLSLALLGVISWGAFEPADTSRKGLRGREEVLEKSNTWPEQVLDTLNSCWRALLESLSNTQANVRCGPLPSVR